MAMHLLAAGHRLAVHTRTRSTAEEVVARGARWVSSARDCAGEADVVFICVTDTPDVERVILGKEGVIERAREGMIVVDHSTISPSATRRMAEVLASRGCSLIDAPVSGGDVGAKNATLSIMCGGDEAAFRQVEPLLRHMGKTITYCGASGNGQLTKLVNQILVSVTCLAVSEALSFARKAGLDEQKTIAAVAGGAAASWQLQNLGPRMVAGDFAPGFMIDLLQKDLRLVLGSAGETMTPLPATELVHQLLSTAQAEGLGRAGTQALFSVLEKLGRGGANAQ